MREPKMQRQCDTEPGSSGSSILDDTTLKVIGIHDGRLSGWNYGTYLANTPIGEFVATAPPPPVSPDLMDDPTSR